MITQSEYLRELAQHTHFTLSDLMSRANRMREAGMLKKGGRGLSAAKIETDEAARIILAIMSGTSAETCPDAVKILFALKPSEKTGTINLGNTLADILSDPAGKADFVKSFTVDHVNNFAIITYTDGREVIFGNKDDEANSGSFTMIHGRIFRLLACSMLPEDENYKNPDYFKWVSQVVKIGNEQGDEAAQAWIKENPFKPVKK